MKLTRKSIDKYRFLHGRVSKRMLLLNIVMAITYFFILAFGFQPGNHLLFYLLIAGEVYHLYQIIGYCISIWGIETNVPFDNSFRPGVDIFVTVCGEPIDIVRTTVRAIKAMRYPNFKVYILNDGLVAKKDNWREVELLAVEEEVICITRTISGGAKAGNINNALKHSDNPYVVIFDADHAPHPDFLIKTIGYFIDSKMAFVQTPQYYKNYQVNMITEAAWDQQSLFFGSIMKGKNRFNSAFMCGTNMILNREAIKQVGGMCEHNIAEDFLTSLFIHQKGWNSYYLAEVLAEGLAPEDFLSYYKQQYRWARGSLEVVFNYNPLFRRGLTFAQKMQYLISASYFLSGIIVVFDAILPLIFLYTGIIAVRTSSMELAIIFIPYIFLTLFTLQLSSNYSVSFKAIAFSLSSFFLQIRALFALLLRQKTSFSVTSKKQLEGNFLFLTVPHITYISLAVIGLAYALIRHGFSASLIANASWALINAAVFLLFIRGSLPQKKTVKHVSEPMVQRAKNIPIEAREVSRGEIV